MRIGLFLDFDGVITSEAVNMQLARFLDVEDEFSRIEASFKRGEINNSEFNKSMIPLFREKGLSRQFIREHYRDIALSEYAEHLVQYCPQDIYIVSSSPDFYITLFTDECGIPRKNVLCAKYSFDENGVIESCKKSITSKNKASFVRKKRKDYDFIFGVGDSQRYDGGFLHWCNVGILLDNNNSRCLRASDLDSTANLLDLMFDDTSPAYTCAPEYRSRVEELLDASAYDKNVFIIMPFREDVRFEAIETTIREALAELGLHAFLVKDRDLDTDALWIDIKCYMQACKYGIAVVTQPTVENDADYNPNVMTEAGYMLGQGKSVLLLKDSTVNMPSDWLGRRYYEFDLNNPKEGIKQAIKKRFSDL